MKHTQTLKLSSILPNPYRDFDLYPIEQGLVDILKASYSERDFGVIAVRPMPDGSFQQVFGHHRIEAMRQLGITEARFLVESVDDDQMVREMVAENAGQRGGSFESQVDSVAAIIRRLSFNLLICENTEQFNELCFAEANDKVSNGTFGKAKANLLKDGSVGQPLISAYAHTLSKGVIDGALAYLKSTGITTSLINKVKAQVEELLAAKTREEKARVKAAAEAAKAAAEEEARAKAAAEASRIAAERATAARRAAAEAKAKADADQARKLEASRKARAAQEAAIRAKAQEAADARKDALRAAQEAAAASAEQSRYLHPDSIRILRGERHQRAALSIIKKAPHAFPINDQPKLFREMYKTIDGGKAAIGKGGETTSDDVAAYLQTIASNADAKYRAQMASIKELQARQSAERAATFIIEELRDEMGRMNRTFGKLDAAMKDPDIFVWLINKNFNLVHALDGMEQVIARLRKQLQVRSQKDPKRIEKPIN
jgi:hypothetical protein